MNNQTRQVVVLGSTGSIGTNTLEVIAASGGKLRACGLTAHHQLDLLQMFPLMHQYLQLLQYMSYLYQQYLLL